MRLRILHETAYRYASPAGRAIQILRLTPRGHEVLSELPKDLQSAII